jgi:hypothetical protein
VNSWAKSQIYKWSGPALDIVKLIPWMSKVDRKLKDEIITNIWSGIPKNKILVFDDLERLATATLVEVLGFINTYTEHQGLKVILLADETKINSKSFNGDNKQEKDYERYKEKMIRFTYLFKPELGDIYGDFLSNYSTEFQAYLKRIWQILANRFNSIMRRSLIKYFLFRLSSAARSFL